MYPQYFPPQDYPYDSNQDTMYNHPYLNRRDGSPNQRQTFNPYVKADFKPSGPMNSLERESQYGDYIKRLSAHILELESENQSLSAHVSALKIENGELRGSFNVARNENLTYKETMKQLYMAFVDQQKQIQQLRYHNSDLMINLDKNSEKIMDASNETQNIKFDRDILETRFVEEAKKFQYDISSLTAQLNDKNLEIAEHRKKVNDLMEIQRRLEEQCSALRFSLENMRQKYENQVREKQLKLQGLERSFAEHSDIKMAELNAARDRIRSLQIQLRDIYRRTVVQ